MKVESQVPPFGQIDVPSVETFVMIGGNPMLVKQSHHEIDALLNDAGAASFVVLTLENGRAMTVRVASIDAVYEAYA